MTKVYVLHLGKNITNIIFLGKIKSPAKQFLFTEIPQKATVQLLKLTEKTITTNYGETSKYGEKIFVYMEKKLQKYKLMRTLKW